MAAGTKRAGHSLHPKNKPKPIPVYFNHPQLGWTKTRILCTVEIQLKPMLLLAGYGPPVDITDVLTAAGFKKMMDKIMKTPK